MQGMSTLCSACRKGAFTRQLSQLAAASVRQAPNSLKQAFKVLDGTVDKASQGFLENAAHQKAINEQYAKVLSVALAGGDEKAKERHTKRNKKVLVRERLKLILDEGSEFMELAPVAGMGMEYGNIPGAGSVMGVGRIHGRLCMILANDATVKGGTLYPISVKKQLRGQQIAQENRLPSVFLVDSGGAFLPLQSEIFVQGGRAFYNEAVQSSMKIPQVAVVVGSCTAGGAYVPTMADEAVIVHKIGTIFLGGPPLVQAALGEIVSSEELGGAHMHSSVSGCTDHYATSEEEAFETARDCIAALNLPEHIPHQDYDEPLYHIDDMLGIIPKHDQHEMDMNKVIARLIDGSRFHQFKSLFGPTLITGFAFIQGHLVGIFGNNGVMSEKAATKGAHFVQLCCQRKVPMIFLQNTPPDTEVNSSVEDGQLAGNTLRAEARMMSAIACAQVPKITIIVGGGYGMQNSVMCGGGMNPRFLFLWPNAQVSMMEPDTLTEKALETFPGDMDPREEAYQETKGKMQEKFLRESSSVFGASRVWNDGIIQPKDTRKVLGQCLDVTTHYRPIEDTTFPVLRM